MRLEADAGAAGARGAELIEAIAFGYIGGGTEDPQVRSGARMQLAYRLEVNEFRGSETRATELPAGGCVWQRAINRAARCASIPAMELNQIKRFIKDLEERTDSLRRYL